MNLGGAHPSEEDTELDFQAEIISIQEKVLPELTDELVSELTEFETVDLLIEDTETRMADMKKNQMPGQISTKLAEALSQLVTQDVPEALIEEQTQQQVQDMAMRMAQQGMQFEQFLEATNQSVEDLVANMREPAEQAVKTDLALRGIAAAEKIEILEDDIDNEIENIAKQYAFQAAIQAQEIDFESEMTPEEIDEHLAPNVEKEKKTLEESLRERGQIRYLKADLLKQKALKLVEELVKIEDENGNELNKDEILGENTENDSNLRQNSNNPENTNPKEEDPSESDD